MQYDKYCYRQKSSHRVIVQQLHPSSRLPWMNKKGDVRFIFTANKIEFLLPKFEVIETGFTTFLLVLLLGNLDLQPKKI